MKNTVDILPPDACLSLKFSLEFAELQLEFRKACHLLKAMPSK